MSRLAFLISVFCLLLSVVFLVPETVSLGSSIPSSRDQSYEMIPLMDLGVDRYLNRFEGGLYPDRSNEPPADHMRAGLQRAALIRPLNEDGRYDTRGKYVLLSIGMSNTGSEYCGAARGRCSPLSFVGQALADMRVEKQELAMVNGAMPGHVSSDWEDSSDPSYDELQQKRLGRDGWSELQVQAVWLKVANRSPRSSLPSIDADAYRLERSMGNIIRALKARYPNLQLVFVSSRTYGGYSVGRKNPEPFAYESGFASKWLIEAQIAQERTGIVDPEAGDLALSRTPWIGWGPYLWAAGRNPRSDGLAWLPEDVGDDGVEVSSEGVRKVGHLLLEFFAASPVARCWFLEGETCAPP